MERRSDSEACFEVRHGDRVVGPVSLDQIRRGVAAGRIPAGAEVRRVTAWTPIGLVSLIEAPPGGERKPCLEVRYGSQVVGPVSLHQLRRGLAVAKIPAAAVARVVWRWSSVERLLAP